jgi:hypothetical protein
MNPELDNVLKQIGADYKDDILENSRFYREVSIGRKAEQLGYSGLKGRYDDVYAIVPLKRPAAGMTVRIDGRTFVNYAQFESGVVVPGYVAKASGLPYRAFVPNDSMILNFA